MKNKIINLLYYIRVFNNQEFEKTEEKKSAQIKKKPEKKSY